MRRLVLLTYICLTLVCFAGCHHWHHKHFTRACCNTCAPCGCADSYAGPVDGVAYPSTVIVPGAPGKGIPLTPGTVLPAAPGVRISSPQG
jgi:hypothetical protein